jgi:hypothetical protein
MQSGRDYVAKHKVAETLQDAVAQVLRDRPDDPIRAISELLMKKTKAPPLTEEEAAAVKMQAVFRGKEARDEHAAANTMKRRNSHSFTSGKWTEQL